MTKHGSQFKRGINPEQNFARWFKWPKVLLNFGRKDGAIKNLQNYPFIPFDNVRIYAYRFVHYLPLSIFGLYCDVKASWDPSKTKSEIGRTNALEKSSIRAE